MKRFMSVLLSAAMVLTAVPVSVTLSPMVEVSADDEEDVQVCQIDVTDYTYEITPILAPFGEYIYVKTDNPDPFSFCFVDYDSVYIKDTSYDDHATYKLNPVRFDDVKYESDDSFRVNGGYIFYAQYVDSDGGELILMQATEEVENKSYTYTWGTNNSIEVYYYDFEETEITVEAPEMVNDRDYLIETYTTSDMDFFEKMDAIGEALDEIAIYPFGVCDSDKPTGIYPFLTYSGYKELTLDAVYSDTYESAEGLLLTSVYPYILDSAGFPSIMTSIAKELEDSVEISYGATHPFRKITYEGETKIYGGAGKGGRNPLYVKYVEELFTFDNSEVDYSSGETIESYCEKIMEYKEIADECVAELADLITGDTFYETIKSTGGTWIRIGGVRSDPYSASDDYAYVVPRIMNESVYIVSDAWVDGRYINAWEYRESATFDEHPTADIVVTDMTYTDADGEVHTQDVVFEYDSDTETWIAGYAYTGYGYVDSMPDEFILTADEVTEMNVDSDNRLWPESGLVYDGTEFPGTEFVNEDLNVLVTGIEAESEITVTTGYVYDVSYEITPSDAYDQGVTVISDDETIAYGTGFWGAHVMGASAGTTTITVVTDDGGHEATCKVTVVDPIVSGDIVCQKNSESTLKVIDYTGGDKYVTIPSEIEGYAVTEIDSEAFYEAGVILEELEDGTLSYSSGVYSVEIPSSVTTIGEYAFENDYWMYEVNLPYSITSIGKGAFANCYLSSITLPSNLTTIDESVFEGCSNLDDIWIPDSVTSIGANAFYECGELTDVYFEGTEEEWNAITIGENNECLLAATIHYNVSSTSSEGTSGSTSGDINEDGFIDYLDAMTALRYDAELITLEDEQTLAGDVNGDGAVDSLDAILILRYDAGLITSF